MIKITSSLETTQGFKSAISVLEVNSYTLTETVQLTNSNQPAMLLPSGKNVNVNYSLYKSQADKAAGASAVQYKDIPMSIYFIATAEDEITESFIYNKVNSELHDKGFNTEFI